MIELEPVIALFIEADTEGVVETVRSVFQEYNFTFDDSGYYADLHHVQQYYLSTGGDFIVLRDGEHVVGTVGITPVTLSTMPAMAHLPAAPTCELHRLYLRKAYRGHGYGRLLMEEILKRAEAKGFARMILWSDVLFIEAHQLYSKLGFEQVGERICDDPDTSHEYGFVKDLIETCPSQQRQESAYKATEDTF